MAPIHDLLVKGSDLIAGTHGRSIWILDDLSPLRNLAEGPQGGVPDGEPYLFAPRDTTRVLPGIDFADEVAGSTNYLTMRPGAFLVETSTDGETIRTNLDVGENPPAGVIVTYRLVAAPEEPIGLTFRDVSGETIRNSPAAKRTTRPRRRSAGSRPRWAGTALSGICGTPRRPGSRGPIRPARNRSRVPWSRLATTP